MAFRAVILVHRGQRRHRLFCLFRRLAPTETTKTSDAPMTISTSAHLDDGEAHHIRPLSQQAQSTSSSEPSSSHSSTDATEPTEIGNKRAWGRRNTAKKGPSFSSSYSSSYTSSHGLFGATSFNAPLFRGRNLWRARKPTKDTSNNNNS